MSEFEKLGQSFRVLQSAMSLPEQAEVVRSNFLDILRKVKSGQIDRDEAMALFSDLNSQFLRFSSMKDQHDAKREDLRQTL